MESLTKQELVKVLNFVFPRHREDKNLAIIVDLPNHSNQDNEAWQKRRKIAEKWAVLLKEAVDQLGIENVNLYAYQNVESANADLPENAYLVNKTLPATSENLPVEGEILFKKVFETNQLFLAPTEYSATAPLKIAAKRYGFRAATMPGFSEKMLPALKVDFELLNKRIQLLKDKLDIANTVNVQFLVDNEKTYNMVFDLFQRVAHISSGQFPQKGMAGNLPSGECFIVPYEGGLGVASRTKGHLPVQFGDEIVEYRVRQNNVSKVLSSGKTSKEQIRYLKKEPAYGNIAELGFGVLSDFGIKSIGEILLDEKLGFHIAFGRSDHFGGITSPAMFSSPKEVVHVDRVYIEEIQPRIQISSVYFEYPNQKKELIIKKGKYVIW
ncbi:hypothetical protein JXQ31_11875 [candidate division KSB1 bacterium]|nr:hypothetical protein [candidate division KSB1 bacterium]